MTTKPKGNQKPKRLASMRHRVVNAACKGHLTFLTHEDAQDQLNFFRRFELPSVQPDEEHALKMWVAGFGITSDEAKEGYMGNFCTLRITGADKLGFRIKADKIDTALKYHPRRKRLKKDMPNWGHPALKKISTGKAVFETEEEAKTILENLRNEFPKTTVPRWPELNELNLMIFSRKYQPKCVKKFVLRIAEQEGRFRVTISEHQAIPWVHRRFNETYDSYLLPLSWKQRWNT
ncbi:MAG: hypothetical protein AAF772_11825 [Acidobacteriota bacterium]